MLSKRKCGVGLAAALAIAVAPGAAAAERGQGANPVSAAGVPGDGTMSAPATRAQREGYLVPQAAEIAREKPAPAGTASTRGTLDVHAPLAPAVVRGFNGIRQTQSAPSDSTGAVGNTRYIELVNTNFAIYDKTSNVPLATGTLNQLAGESAANNIFDPQVIWDPQTKRFYYAMDDVASATDNRVAFGFSKTASPSGAADFCHYVFNYGSFFPDYPKLGDSTHFIFTGVNTFNSSEAFVGSDLIWISKPAAGTTCPSPATFHAGTETDLANPGGTPAFTPVGVNQTDTNASGWAVAVNSNPSTKLTLFRVTRSAAGDAVVSNPGTQVTVPSYSAPPNVPQQGTTNQLDSLDRRLTQAVSAIDPGHASKVGIWTQHTVASSGGRSEVRWYEIDPIARTLLQSGKVASASLFYFNGSISPDRAVNGTAKSGGRNMVMGVDRSSATTFPRVSMVSKVGAGAQSAPVAVKASTTFYRGFDCPPNPCRWGDYAASTPDPTPPAGTTRVWSTSQYAVSNPNPLTSAGWGTWNWVATP
jgi:hypothetical protein